MSSDKTVYTGVCPYCKHQWTYKERILGYVIKPRTRTRCPKCREYLEPSTKTLIYEYIALFLILFLIIFIIPQLTFLYWTRFFLALFVFLAYVLVFIPLSVRFEKIHYNVDK